MKRSVAVGLLVAAIVVLGAGIAVAGVSDGNYSPERQGCPPYANDNEHEDTPFEGCQNFTVNMRDGNDQEVVRAGLPQLAEGENPNPADATVEPSPDSGFDPSTGVRLYIGADDNLNSGEHDGADSMSDGPSDGGAIVLNIEPSSVAVWLAALITGDSQYVLTHPTPLVDAGFGACADGVCFAGQTQRRLAYDGQGDGPDRSVANYEGKEWDPETCSGEGTGPEDCGHPRPDTCEPDDQSADCQEGLAWWHYHNGDAYVDPGLQVYEDPSPAGSPLGPYPLPAVYAGTCGIILGGGPAAQMPASPVTNGAGQVVILTQC